MPIFDQGYQHWSGKLSGHAVRWLAVTRHGVRATLRGRWVKLMLISAWLPAIMLVTALAVWGLLEQRAESVLSFLSRMLPADVIAKPQEFRSAVWTIAYSIFYKCELAAAIFLVLVVGPSLVSKDLRFNAFPLYFSRPIRRIDYFVGKLGVIGFFLMAIAILPGLAAYLLGLAFSLDLAVIRDTHRLLWGGVLYGLVITVSAGTLMLALSSLSRRSIYVGLAWAGFCFITWSLSGMLIALNLHSEIRAAEEETLAAWMAEHPPPPGITVRGPGWVDRRWSNNDQMRAQESWLSERRAIRERYTTQVAANVNSDWRQLLAYHTNLSRIGDALLDTDTAWVTIGTAFERSRRAVGPMTPMGPNRMLQDLLHRPNDRFLADRLVLQYPVIWSVGILAGLWLLSAFILATRVKSLDRLK
jgi:hypothetical protein